MEPYLTTIPSTNRALKVRVPMLMIDKEGFFLQFFYKEVDKYAKA